jgi:hypothetical protein
MMNLNKNGEMHSFHFIMQCLQLITIKFHLNTLIGLSNVNVKFTFFQTFLTQYR